jgi:hypothetical protein
MQKRTILVRDGALFVAGRPLNSNDANPTSHFVELMEVWI